MTWWLWLIVGLVCVSVVLLLLVWASFVASSRSDRLFG
jgi:hypothetical protein